MFCKQGCELSPTLINVHSFSFSAPCPVLLFNFLMVIYISVYIIYRMSLTDSLPVFVMLPVRTKCSAWSA